MRRPRGGPAAQRGGRRGRRSGGGRAGGCSGDRGGGGDRDRSPRPGAHGAPPPPSAGIRDAPRVRRRSPPRALGRDISRTAIWGQCVAPGPQHEDRSLRRRDTLKAVALPSAELPRSFLRGAEGRGRVREATGVGRTGSADTDPLWPGGTANAYGDPSSPHAVARERIRPSRSPGGTPPGSAQKGLRKTQHVAEDVKPASGGKPPRAPSWPGGTNWQRSFQGREAGTGGAREPRVIRILLEDRI